MAYPMGEAKLEPLRVDFDRRLKLEFHGRYITFQLAEVAIPRPLFAEILRLIDGLRPAPLPAMTPPHPVASRSPG